MAKKEKPRSPHILKDLAWYDTPRGKKFKKMQMQVGTAQAILHHFDNFFRNSLQIALEESKRMKALAGSPSKKVCYTEAQLHELADGLNSIRDNLTCAYTSLAKVGMLLRVLKAGG